MTHNIDEHFMGAADTLYAERFVDGPDMWTDSPFQWIKNLPSSAIGATGAKLVEHWATSKKFAVDPSGTTEFDRYINRMKIEVKTSTLWKDTGKYTFQQLRDQDYEYAFLLGISPFDVHAWLVPKFELMEENHPEIRGQHGGAIAVETRWLTFNPENPPAWLSKYGGSLTQVETLIHLYSSSVGLEDYSEEDPE